MTSGPEPLREQVLREMLVGEAFVERLIVLDEVSSTNDELRRLAAEGATAGTVVFAERQTAGRGRLRRPWYSPRGRGLYMSVLFRPGGATDELTRWTLAAAVAACSACRQLGGDSVEIRWPNDLLWRGRKLGGILAETRSGKGPGGEMVIGIGLNVANDAAGFPDELSSSAASLAEATGGKAPDRETLAAICLRELAELSRLLDRGAWAAVARRWEGLAPGAHGQRVKVIDRSGGGQYLGVTRGLDATGALRVARSDGRIETVRSVESVRPVEEESCC